MSITQIVLLGELRTTMLLKGHHKFAATQTTATERGWFGATGVSLGICIKPNSSFMSTVGPNTLTIDSLAIDSVEGRYLDSRLNQRQD